MTQAAKFPAAIAALADFFAEQPNQPANEVVLNADIIATTLSIVATANIPASWPATGRMIIDGEVIEYASYAAATFTIASTAKRGLETAFGSTAAAAHTAGAIIGNWVTAQAIAQIIAEIIAMQTQTVAGAATNYIVNGDFSRRTVMGLAMPENFADANGFVQVSGTGGVAGNVYTATAAGEIAWCNQSFVWRDGRASITFKAINVNDRTSLFWRIDANNIIEARQNAGVFGLYKTIAGTPTTVTTVANVLTVNRWYWIELEKQGTTISIRMFDTGGTVTNVAKVASTLITATVLTGTVSDASVQVGAHISAYTSNAAGQFGGVPLTPGGAYVETWLPESWTFGFNTLGGQAFGFDESADSGPIGRQWAAVYYNPATTRGLTLTQNTPDGTGIPSTTYTGSSYIRVTGYSGTGNLVEIPFYGATSALGTFTAVADLGGSGNTAWVRRTGSGPTGASSRRFSIAITLGVSNGGASAGTAYFTLLQLEQTGTVTSWRNAPADDAPIVWEFVKLTNTTPATGTQVDARDYAGNIFLPWDARLELTMSGAWQTNTATSTASIDVEVDGGAPGSDWLLTDYFPVVSSYQPFTATRTLTQAAGKHRVNTVASFSAGVLTIRGNTAFRVVAYRGK